MEYFDALEERKELLAKQIESLQALPPKQFLKQQQNELSEKKKDIKDITDQLKVVFKQKQVGIESAPARWVIPAGKSRKIYFRLIANKICDDHQKLKLMSRTTSMEIPIELHTQCDWPHIREDFEHILPEQFHSYSAK